MTVKVQEFSRKEPMPVEAVRWLPDSAATVHHMVDWLMSRRCEFRVCYKDDGPFRGTPIIAVETDRNPQDFEYAWPGDWVIREGARVYRTTEAEVFELNYGEVL